MFETIIKSPTLLSPVLQLLDVSHTLSIGVLEMKEEKLVKEPELEIVINTSKGMLLRQSWYLALVVDPTGRKQWEAVVVL